MNKHYLVTGGTGFIGSGVVKALLKAGHKITILDDNSRGRPRRLEGFLKDVRMVDGDVEAAKHMPKAHSSDPSAAPPRRRAPPVAGSRHQCSKRDNARNPVYRQSDPRLQ